MLVKLQLLKRLSLALGAFKCWLSLVFLPSRRMILDIIEMDYRFSPPFEKLLKRFLFAGQISRQKPWCSLVRLATKWTGRARSHGSWNFNWLVIWNHGILWISIYWEYYIIPTDFHMFQRGRSTTNQSSCFVASHVHLSRMCLPFMSSGLRFYVQ